MAPMGVVKRQTVPVTVFLAFAVGSHWWAGGIPSDAIPIVAYAAYAIPLHVQTLGSSELIRVHHYEVVSERTLSMKSSEQSASLSTISKSRRNSKPVAQSSWARPPS